MDVSQSMAASYEKVAQYIPNLFLAGVVLVAGWLGAKLLSKLAHQILVTGDLDLRLSRWLNIEPFLGESEKARRKVAKGLELLIYYFCLLLVLIVFLEVLGDTTIIGILEELLKKVSGHFSNFLGGLAILALGWVVALVLKFAAVRTIRSTHLSEKLNRAFEAEEPGRPPAKDMAESLGDVVFYVVLLFALPGFLEAVGLNSLMKPFQDMFGRAMGFLPNILVAGVILVFGYFLARLCERLVANFAVVLGVNRYVDGLSFDSVLKSLDIARILGTLAFLVVMVPVLTATFETLQMPMITSVFTGMMVQVSSAVPLVAGAFVLVILGLIIGRYLGDLAAGVLHNAGFDVLLGRIGLGVCEKQGEEEDKGVQLSKVAGNVINAVIVLILSMEGFRLMKLNLIAEAINRLLLYLPNVLVAFVVLGLGFYLAGVVQEMVKRSFASERSLEADTVGLVLRYAVIVFAFFMAFDQLGVAHSIVVNAFIILLGTVGLALALAFGIGSREHAADYVKHLLDRGKSKPDAPPHKGK
jgi:hypothetical protein